MQYSIFNLTFQIVIGHPATSNNCNSVVPPFLLMYCDIPGEDISAPRGLSQEKIQFTFDVLWIAWVLVSSETQVRPQIILDPNYLPDYLSVSYDYA